MFISFLLMNIFQRNFQRVLLTFYFTILYKKLSRIDDFGDFIPVSDENNKMHVQIVSWCVTKLHNLNYNALLTHTIKKHQMGRLSLPKKIFFKF